MAVYDGSRYETAAEVRITDAKGRKLPALYRVPGAEGFLQYRRHIVQAGERYDTIAYSVFGDAEQWWRIAEINPEYLYPDALPEGAVVRIPL